MNDVLTVLLGVGIGGLGLSTGWGLVWLTTACAGYVRRTCAGTVVRASLMATLVPGLLLGLLLWAARGERWGSLPLAIGVLVIPFIGIGLGMRTLPDGTRVAGRLFGGAQTMMNTILGRHHSCGACGDDHHHHEDRT